jgi:hypothetical protein
MSSIKPICFEFYQSWLESLLFLPSWSAEVVLNILQTCLSPDNSECYWFPAQAPPQTGGPSKKYPVKISSSTGEIELLGCWNMVEESRSRRRKKISSMLWDWNDFIGKSTRLHYFFKTELPGWDRHIARTSCSLTDDHHTEQPIWRDRSGFLVPWCATNYGLLAHRSVGWFPQYRCQESSLSTRWRAQSD